MKENIESLSQNFRTYIIGNINDNTNNSKEEQFATKASNNKEQIISYALTGKISKLKLRAIVYKFLLRELHIEKTFDIWLDQQIQTYQRYVSLKNKHSQTFNITSLKNKTIDPLKWDSLYKDNDIRSLIDLDLSRTYQEIELFQQKETKDMLSSIIYIYSCENKVEYKQGMNEIVSMLYLALYPYYFPYSKYAKVNNANDISNVIKELELIYKTKVRNDYIKSIYLFFHNDVFLEGDLYYLYETLMNKDLFKIYANKENLIKRAEYINDTYINLCDNELYRHFTIQNVHCGIAIERYLKCLLGREFPYEQCLILWDAIIANELIDESTGIKREFPLNFLDFIIVAMIEHERDTLLIKDESECLGHLLHYPQIDNIFDLISLAEDKRIIISDIMRKKRLGITNRNNREEEIGKQLIPEDNFPTFDYEPNDNDNTKESNEIGNSLSAFLKNTKCSDEKGNKKYKGYSTVNSNTSNIKTETEYKSAVVTIENLVNKYKDKFSENDFISIKLAFETIHLYNNQ